MAEIRIRGGDVPAPPGLQVDTAGFRELLNELQEYRQAVRGGLEEEKTLT